MDDISRQGLDPHRPVSRCSDDPLADVGPRRAASGVRRKIVEPAIEFYAAPIEERQRVAVAGQGPP